MTLATSMNTILKGEAQKALDATWESGSFFGHDPQAVMQHWYEVNFLLECAQEAGDTNTANECETRLQQIDKYIEISNS